jgi:hypothetical protein
VATWTKDEEEGLGRPGGLTASAELRQIVHDGHNQTGDENRSPDENHHVRNHVPC